jgi:sugar phosphate permease
MPDRRWMHIIPVAFIMYTIAFVDRTNISLALPAISRDLHMDPQQAGSAAGIFFWGYLVLQIPGGYLASHWSAKRFVAVLLAVWGVCAVLTGLVRTGREFWMMRLLLGIAEGGVWPATLVLLAHWFPRPERARANAYWMLCLPVAVVVSSPISGWILGRYDWRVLLIFEGAWPILWLGVWVLFMSDHPRHARWISPQERDYLETTLAREAADVEPLAPEPYLRTLLRPHVLVMVAVYFLLNTGNYGYLFWLPTALESHKRLSDFVVGLLFTLPFLLTALGMVIISRHSDRTRERSGHVAVGLIWGGVLLLAGVALSQHSQLLSFALVALVGAGSYGALGPFWAIPSESLPESAAGAAMGLVNALGNLGGWFGPRVVGYLNQRTGNFIYAFSVLGAGLLLGGILAWLFLPRVRRT